MTRTSIHCDNCGLLLAGAAHPGVFWAKMFLHEIPPSSGHPWHAVEPLPPEFDFCSPLCLYDWLMKPANKWHNLKSAPAAGPRGAEP